MMRRALPNVCREKPPIPLQFILLRNEYADHLRGLGQKKSLKSKLSRQERVKSWKALQLLRFRGIHEYFSAADPLC